MLRTVVLLFLFSPFLASAQIVNIESLRLNNDSSGLSGQEVFTFKITRNTAELYEVNNNLALQYRKQRHILLFLSNVNFTFSRTTDFERNGFFHGRYNYEQNDWLTYEYFNQYQVDIPLRIEQRILTGLGPRFTLWKKDKSKVVLGTLAMYEYDKELNNSIIHRDFRMSNYLSLSLRKKRFRATALIYYQPRIDLWADFRTSAQMQLSLDIWKNFAFTTTGVLAYDAFPVDDPAIPNLTYKLANGISYSF